MKRPSPASLKRLTPDNLTRLGAERLAAILLQTAEVRPELKRRLRMELAAEQGAGHLAVEIDKRLASLEASRSKVSWRKRPTFVHDLEILRGLIAERLAELDAALALDRLWPFLALERGLSHRLHDKDGDMAAIFARAAEDAGRLMAGPVQTAHVAGALADALAADPTAWSSWLPAVTRQAPADLMAATLHRLLAKPGASPGRTNLVRRLADAAHDVDAFQQTFSTEAQRNPAIAAQIAQRLLEAGRTEDAGLVLELGRTATVKPAGRFVIHKPAPPDIDFDWETVWIDYLDQSGQPQAAQDARWASFERTLSVERARAFTRRLKDFEDVEAEERAFALAAAHADFEQGLGFLVQWPALPEAARMIKARAEDIRLSDVHAEHWAAQLRTRHALAAETLLRKAAAAAFRRRDLETSARFTQEADDIAPS
jgi:hypothetical protein